MDLALYMINIIILLFFVTDVLYQSPAGAMLSQVIHALLLLPVYVIRPLLHALLSLLPHLDRLNCLLPASSALEGEELDILETPQGTAITCNGLVHYC